MIMNSADEILIMIQRYLILATDAYETVKKNTSSMEDPSAQVIKYRSYLFSTSVVFTLKYIPGRNIFMSGDNKEHLNGALKVVDFHLIIIFKYLIIPL